jgi:multiple sugar transport system permease protein
MLQTEVPEQLIPTTATNLAKPSPQGKRSTVNDWWIYILLTLGLLVMVVPFIWMILSSLKGNAELSQIPPTWFPQALTWSNYSKLFIQLNFPVYFLNSIILGVSVTVLNLVFCSMLGYALAKLKFRGKTALFGLVLTTIMIPAAVTLVPLFVLMSKIGLTNNLLAVILPEAAGGIGVFLMRQFMQGIPDELLDAGRVDGAGEFYLFWRVVLPQCGPALATLTILQFLASWNDFTYPLIMLNNDQSYNLPVALATFANGPHVSDNGLLLAGAVVIVVPMLIVFFLLQRYFTQGIVTTGLKG